MIQTNFFFSRRVSTCTSALSVCFVCNNNGNRIVWESDKGRHRFTGGEIRSGSSSTLTSAFLLSDWWTRFHRDYKFLKSDAGLDRRNKDDDFFQRNVIAVTSFSFPLFSPNTFARWRRRKSRKVCHLATWMNFSRISHYETRKWIGRIFFSVLSYFFLFYFFFFLSFFRPASLFLSLLTF